MVAIVAGVETLVSVVPARRRAVMTTIFLTRPERLFLMCRLAEVSAVAERVTHQLEPGAMRAPWGRRQVVMAIHDLIGLLRRNELLHVGNGAGIRRRLLREAIEGNPYFVRMADDDPRLCPDAIGMADALRVKLMRSLGMMIGPVPIGRDRRRRPPVLPSAGTETAKLPATGARS